MMKKISIFLIIIILGLGILGPSICRAELKAPTNLQVPVAGEGSAILSWEWEPPTDPEKDGIIHRFEISYRDINDPSLRWITPASQPDGSLRSWMLGGLAENTTYEWTIMAKAVKEKDNSLKAASSAEDNNNIVTTVGVVPPPPEEDGTSFLGPVKLRNPLNQDSLEDAIDAVLDFFVLASFGIAPGLIIYSAFLMIFAAGDAAKISRAKNIIFWTMIALAVILFAKGLPSVIKGAFGT